MAPNSGRSKTPSRPGDPTGIFPHCLLTGVMSDCVPSEKAAALYNVMEAGTKRPLERRGNRPRQKKADRLRNHTDLSRTTPRVHGDVLPPWDACGEGLSSVGALNGVPYGLRFLFWGSQEARHRGAVGSVPNPRKTGIDFSIAYS